MDAVCGNDLECPVSGRRRRQESARARCGGDRGLATIGCDRHVRRDVLPPRACGAAAHVIGVGFSNGIEKGGHTTYAQAGIRIGCELQILFYRVIADGYVNQCSTLKSRDEFVVFDRIDGDATVAQGLACRYFSRGKRRWCTSLDAGSI